MDKDIQKQLDQFGDVVDSKIEKAFNQSKDNAKGEISNEIKNEIDALSKQFIEKHDAIEKRFDSFEVEQNRKLAANERKSFKGNLEQAFKDGAVDSLKKGNSNAASFEVKADMTMAADFTNTVAGEEVVGQIKHAPSRIDRIRSIMPIGTTNAQTIRFPKETGYSDNAAAKAEGAALGQTDFDVTGTSVNLERIGTYLRLTDEMLSDTPTLASYLAARIPAKVLNAEDNEILNGDGSSPNLDGLMTDATAFVTGVSGVFTGEVESANQYDVLIAAINQLAIIDVVAEGIILNPSDFHKLVLLKNSQNSYLKEQLWQGIKPTIAGLPVYLNPSMTAGKFITGAFSTATQLWIRENLSVSFSREDSDNFQKNFITVKAQERVAVTNYVPTSMVQGTFSSAKSALETS